MKNLIRRRELFGAGIGLCATAQKGQGGCRSISCRSRAIQRFSVTLGDAAVTLVVVRLLLIGTSMPRPWRFAPRDLPGYQRASLVISATISSVLQGREK